ncbi:hypothetical protein ACFOWM_07250 [Ferruginibacter yonginensis]|uniref:Uncharacterized protein n=1 Tax=Ferruginibacter yonginensis TaxID=1310416 RepID=A0ABV8QR33_9BACT
MNNKKIIPILFILLIITVIIYLLTCNKKNSTTASLPTFNLQGTTEITYGDIGCKLWDNEAEDGDTVKVYVDGNLIKDSIELRNEPITLNLGTLKKGTHILGVVAISEGYNSPATASIGLFNKTEIKEFIMNATKDSAASWNIIIK